MRKIITFLFLCLSMAAWSQAKVSVAKFKGNAKAAVSYTFDDGLLEQYTELFPQLKKYGIKGSFCLNGNTINRYEHMIATGDTTDALVREKPRMTWAMVKEMSDQGQEMTSHGWAHINVRKINGEALRYELEHNDSVIFQHTGRYPRTFFYPGNAKDSAKVACCEKGRVGTRTFQVSVGSKRSEQWLREWINELFQKKEWGVGMTHGISRGYDHFPNPEVLWNHFAYVTTLQDSLWIGTFHDVCAYVKERNAIQLKVKEKGNTITVMPNLSLDKELFNEPLTLVIDSHVLSVIQDGKSLPFINKDGKTLVEFNPHGKKIVIKLQEVIPVYLVAGQSNTDGRVGNELLPDYIQKNKYHHCYWSYGSGTHSGAGKFELFWPRIINKNKPGRWAYDAIVNYWLEQSLKQDFYVIKESLGGTAIDPAAPSSGKHYWCASPAFLDSTAASDKGGKSLLKAFTENIGACIDGVLSQQHPNYEIKALLWHQGESDRTTSSRYYDNLKAVVSYIRQYLVEKTGNQRYATLPVIAGSIVRAGRGYSKEVEEAQLRLQKEDANFYLVDVGNTTLQQDNMHFDEKGTEFLGRKMYNQLVNLHLAGKKAKKIAENGSK